MYYLENSKLKEGQSKGILYLQHFLTQFLTYACGKQREGGDPAAQKGHLADS